MLALWDYEITSGLFEHVWEQQSPSDNQDCVDTTSICSLTYRADTQHSCSQWKGRGDGVRSHHVTQNVVQLKTDELSLELSMQYFWT